MHVRPRPKLRTVKRWPLTAAALALALGGIFAGVYLRRSSRVAHVSGDTTPDEAARTASRLTSLPATAPGLAPGAAPMAPEISERVAPLMLEWRNAILQRNPEVVESLDRAFADHPAAFVPALMVSAQGDPDERVRAFSTRVLGKLRPPESVDLMRKLLGDQSEHVRFNAAWALGELGDRSSAARLRQAQSRDPSANVRRSAGDSLKKMEGG